MLDVAHSVPQTSPAQPTIASNEPLAISPVQDLDTPMPNNTPDKSVTTSCVTSDIAPYIPDTDAYLSDITCDLPQAVPDLSQLGESSMPDVVNSTPDASPHNSDKASVAPDAPTTPQPQPIQVPNPFTAFHDRTTSYVFHSMIEADVDLELCTPELSLDDMPDLIPAYDTTTHHQSNLTPRSHRTGSVY